MKAPSSAQRSSISFMSRSPQQALDRGLTSLVAAGDLGLQRVDALVQGAPLRRDIGLVRRQLVDERGEIGGGQLAEGGQATGTRDLVEGGGVDVVEILSEQPRQPAVAGCHEVIAED